MNLDSCTNVLFSGGEYLGKTFAPVDTFFTSRFESINDVVHKSPTITKITNAISELFAYIGMCCTEKNIIVKSMHYIGDLIAEKLSAIGDYWTKPASKKTSAGDGFESAATLAQLVYDFFECLSFL